jgi:hypothetical protein
MNASISHGKRFCICSLIDDTSHGMAAISLIIEACLGRPSPFAWIGGIFRSTCRFRR